MTTIENRPPERLDDFVMDDVVTLTVASAHQVVTIEGSSRLDGDSILVYEKDGDGKDVRTWRIKQQHGRFEAYERSMY
ncbi:MAG: hypothetical protein ABI658_11745 [Acidimicrobiales bacterium]